MNTDITMMNRTDRVALAKLLKNYNSAEYRDNRERNRKENEERIAEENRRIEEFINSLDLSRRENLEAVSLIDWKLNTGDRGDYREANETIAKGFAEINRLKRKYAKEENPGQFFRTSLNRLEKHITKVDDRKASAEARRSREAAEDKAREAAWEERKNRNFARETTDEALTELMDFLSK